jgi:hypothetical protein
VAPGTGHRVESLKGHAAQVLPWYADRRQGRAREAREKDIIKACQKAPLRERMIGADPEFFLDYHFQVQNGTPGALTAEALQE